jgi:transcriptional regulator with XRE-family HTH domain
MKNNISIKIRSIRERYNMSQERFGLKIGVSGKTISAYETGKCSPPLRILEKISQVYDESFVQIKSDKRDDLKSKLDFIKESISEIEELLNRSLSY